MIATELTWTARNQQAISAALSEVRWYLEHPGSQEQPPQDREGEPFTSALDVVVQRFGLSNFESRVLMLCAGVELDSGFRALCGDLGYPTFSLALSALPNAHWSALTPAAPLRRWHLIEVKAADSVATSRLKIDERVLHFLTGVGYLDESLSALLEPVQTTVPLANSQEAVAQRVQAAWAGLPPGSVPPVIQICGDDRAAKRAVARAACSALGLSLFALDAGLLPAVAADLEFFTRIWEREAALSKAALLLEFDDFDTPDAARNASIARFVEGARGALILSSRDKRRTTLRPVITVDAPRATTQEQRALWESLLGSSAQSLNGILDRVTAQFHLRTPAILAAGSEAAGLIGGDTQEGAAGRILWDACRIQSRPHLDELAQRIEPQASWSDFVLPETQLGMLRDILVQVRNRARVYETWGFAAKSSRGLGISALFAGASGTGKTMAAEVLARDLRLDLYKIDLSALISKYIGETEKNLRRVFDAAEDGGAILLFDEADALFGKRGEVKDSHDRYANIEISYLLQRMESYRGLAILTTNMKSALDTAFLRRLRFVIEFPFPDSTQRAAIWLRVFPDQTPVDKLDFDRLAKLNVAGGNIRNIALHAAFLAAEDRQPVRMDHLLRAARTEYTKLEKALSDREVAGWV
jgi:hypothetical protein